jgi:hypothetical protein
VDQKMTYILNGTAFDFNDTTGELISLSTPSGRVLISNGHGLFDLAVPVKYDYEILRMKPNFMNAGKVDFEYGEGTLRVNYRLLGLNMIPREDIPQIAGGVEAELTLSECPDGRSVSMRLTVRNNCDAEVRQVIFPDFNGLDPVSSPAETRFTTLGFTSRPFTELADNPDTRTGFFGVNPMVTGVIEHSGGYFGSRNMIGRWYDYGSLEGGYSLFHKWWGFGPDNMNTMSDEYYVKLDQNTIKLRIGGIHYVNIPRGGVYQSQEYIFTPHEGGWINGIGPYKDWVNANKKRVAPPSEKVTKALGYRTIWACEQYPKDTDSVKYRYEDLPKVAADMLEHGLIDMSAWGLFDMVLPLEPGHFPHSMGGFEDFKKAAAACRAMGIDIVPFVSFVSIWRETCPRYGLQIGPAQAGWSENLKGLPMFQTPYMERYCCQVIDQSNKLWQSDVMAALRFLRDEAGTPSIGWDQYIGNNVEGGVRDIIDAYTRETRAVYPDSTISSESTFNYEADINALDYTWDWEYWPGTGDCRPYINVVKTTRPNINIDANPEHVKLCFMDNVFMNVYPSRPGDINGSAYIYEYPELSAALKRAAAWRKKYLEFFTDGEIIGDCVLARDAVGARVTAYRLRDRYLIFAYLTGENAELTLLSETGEFTAVYEFYDPRPVETDRKNNAVYLNGKVGSLYIFEV